MSHVYTNVQASILRAYDYDSLTKQNKQKQQQLQQQNEQ